MFFSQIELHSFSKISGTVYLNFLIIGSLHFMLSTAKSL